MKIIITSIKDDQVIMTNFGAPHAPKMKMGINEMPKVKQGDVIEGEAAITLQAQWKKKLEIANDDEMQKCLRS